MSQILCKGQVLIAHAEAPAGSDDDSPGGESCDFCGVALPLLSSFPFANNKGVCLYMARAEGSCPLIQAKVLP